MVPTQFHRLLQLPEGVRARADVSSLHAVVHSAAPCPLEVKRRMMEWWGPVIWETYGGMEGPATIAKPHRWLEKPGTVGRADPGHPPGHPRRRRSRAGAGGDRWDLLRLRRAVVRVRRRRGDDARRVPRAALHHRRRRIRRRRRLSLHLRPRQGHDHHRRCQRVPPGGRSGAGDAPGGRRRRGHRAARRRMGRDDRRGRATGRRSRRPTTRSPTSCSRTAEAQLAKYKCPRRVEFRASLPRTDAGKLSKRTLRDEYAGQPS